MLVVSSPLLGDLVSFPQIPGQQSSLPLQPLRPAPPPCCGWLILVVRLSGASLPGNSCLPASCLLKPAFSLVFGGFIPGMIVFSQFRRASLCVNAALLATQVVQ